MSRPPLTLVNGDLDQMENLRKEMKRLAMERVSSFETALGVALAHAEEIERGGENFSVGLREECRIFIINLRSAIARVQKLRQL